MILSNSEGGGQKMRPSHRADVDVVACGPFRLADHPMHELVEIIHRENNRSLGPLLALALHIGGLTLHKQEAFVQAFNEADLAYADGVGAVALARVSGARRIGRAPTTDLGWSVLERLGRGKPGRLRVALLGGPPGLAERAGEALEERAGVEVVAAIDGYREDWVQELTHLRESKPDVLFVGLGMPREAHWVVENREALPPCLVMTCGGWFGFLAGEEARAPRAVQRAGLEWTWRLAQQPRRLSGRYLGGLLVLARLMLRAVGARIRRREAVAA